MKTHGSSITNRKALPKGRRDELWRQVLNGVKVRQENATLKSRERSRAAHAIHHRSFDLTEMQ